MPALRWWGMGIDKRKCNNELNIHNKDERNPSLT
jgi:hypothetical protein